MTINYMLKKIRQKLADIKNKFRKNKISEGIEGDALELPPSEKELSPFDQLVRNNTSTSDKTGEVQVGTEGLEKTAEELSTTPAYEPTRTQMSRPDLSTPESLPEIPATPDMPVIQNEMDEADKTPAPKFDTIPPRAPRFDSISSVANANGEEEAPIEENGEESLATADGSQPLYKMPKKYQFPKRTRMPWLTVPLAKITGAIAPLFKSLLSKIKKDRPDLFQGSEKGGVKLNFNKVYEIVFSPDSRPTIHLAFIILLVVLSSYGVGKTVALLLRGKDAPPMAKAKTIDLGPMSEEVDFNSIRLANLFNAHDVQDIKKNRSQDNTPCTLADAQSSSSLPIKVLNTVVLQDSVKSLAAVQVRGRPTLLEFREGEKIDNIARLDKIDRLRIIFRNLESNQCEYAANNAENARGNAIQVMSPTQAKTFTQAQGHPDITNDGNKFTIKRRYMNEKLKDIGLVLTQAKAVKITNPDGSLAFKMTEVDPGGPFASLNVKMEDTITGVNGKKFTSMNEVMDLFGKIKDMNQLSITVIREGEEQVMEYNFTN